MTWEDHRGPDTDIYVQHLDASGARLLSDSGLAVCAAAGNQFAPWSTTDGAGGLIVGWCDERAGAAARDIFAQRVDSNGATRWAAQGRPICNATGQQTSVSGCADLAGGAILAWRDRRDDAGDIYAARVASNGALGVLAVPPVAEGGHLSRVTVAPCPASGPLTLSFTLPREGDVEVEVFDITGRRVRSLMGGVRPNGLHSLQWDLRDDAGSPVDAGVYLARVRGSGEVQRSRTVVIR